MSDAQKLMVAFVVLGAIAIVVFLVVAWSTRRPSEESEEEEIHRRGYAIRGRWFVGLMLSLLVVFVATIPFFPYMPSAQALAPADRVPVVAAQFRFIMPDHLPLNQRILFEVTSWDVNHGFGIYDPDGRLIAQTQAMPDYINYLEVTFHRPGRYKVLCLEYCGLGHPVMEKSFTVGGAQ